MIYEINLNLILFFEQQLIVLFLDYIAPCLWQGAYINFLETVQKLHVRCDSLKMIVFGIISNS